MYSFHETDRIKWRYEVRYNNGRVYARCTIKQDAEKIAAALNTISNNPQARKEAHQWEKALA